MGGPPPEWEGIDKTVRGVFPGDHQRKSVAVSGPCFRVDYEVLRAKVPFECALTMIYPWILISLPVSCRHPFKPYGTKHGSLYSRDGNHGWIWRYFPPFQD